MPIAAVLLLALLAEDGGGAAPSAAPEEPPRVVPAAAAPVTPRPAAVPRVPPVAATPTAKREPRRARASGTGLVLELRSEFGFSRLLEVEFTNEHRVAMHLNDGLAIAAGVSFLPLEGGRLVTRLSAGVKIDRLRADNGSAVFTAFPVDLMEAAYVGPLRVGAGVSLLVAPRVRADGIFDRAAAAFGPAAGVVADAEWIVSPGARTGIGLRASWYRFAADGYARGAPALGLVIRADL